MKVVQISHRNSHSYLLWRASCACDHNFYGDVINIKDSCLTEKVVKSIINAVMHLAKCFQMIYGFVTLPLSIVFTLH